MQENTAHHYDELIQEGNDPVLDSDELKQYMEFYDGPAFFDRLELSQSNLLEIGVGSGRTALKALGYGPKAYLGIDISPLSLERAASHLKNYQNVSLKLQAIETFEPNMMFDVVFSVLTLFHIEDIETALDKISLILKPGGRLGISVSKVPNEAAFEGRIVTYFDRDASFYIDALSRRGFTLFDRIDRRDEDREVFLLFFQKK